MRYLLLCSVALVVALNLGAAPVPKGKPEDPSLYFPTRVGSKWVYETSDGKEHTEVLTAVELKQKGQVWVVAVGGLDKWGKVTPHTEWEVSAQGLVLTKAATEKDRIAWSYLKLPHRADAKWDFWSDSETFRCVAIEPKKVKVPAGEFDAIGVELYFKEHLFETRWYAPGVGLVMSSYGDKAKPHLVLKSFTPAKN